MPGVTESVIKLPNGGELGPGLDKEIAERIRAAAGKMAREGATRQRPLTKRDREAFLAALAAGLDVDDAAAAVGRALSTLYQARNRDPEFAAKWAAALEAGCEPIIRNLRGRVEAGPLDSMAAVRAAEVILRARHPRFAPPSPQSAKASIDAHTGQISIAVGGAFPE